MKHTPWKIEADLDGEVPSIYIVGSGGELIAEIVGARTYGMEHSRLIAAAPEMLEELIDVYRKLHRVYNMDEMRALIECATGKKIEEVV
jgi:hypothetical protein